MVNQLEYLIHYQSFIDLENKIWRWGVCQDMKDYSKSSSFGVMPSIGTGPPLHGGNFRFESEWLHVNRPVLFGVTYNNHCFSELCITFR